MAAKTKAEVVDLANGLSREIIMRFMRGAELQDFADKYKAAKFRQTAGHNPSDKDYEIAEYFAEHGMRDTRKRHGFTNARVNGAVFRVARHEWMKSR